MAGMEIAGVVLAVIPLLQHAIDQFQGDQFQTLLKYRQKLRSLSRKLALEHAQFRNTCEKLLLPLVEEERVAELVSGPTASKWKDEDLESDLREHLGDKNYELYVETLKDLAQCIVSLREELGLGDMKPKNSEKWYEKASRKLKLSINHKMYLSSLEEIQQCNQSLRHLVTDQADMPSIRTTRKTKLDTKKWESLRKLADSLHRTLEDGLSCNCGHCHMAHLRLESRHDQEALDVRFGVLFSIDEFPRPWHETEIRIVRSEPSRPSTQLVRTNSRVQWEGTSDELDDEDTEAASPSENSRIDDLCRELLGMKKEGGCIGFLDDSSNREYYIHHVYPPTTFGDDLSLNQWLSRKDGEGMPSLPGRDKYELALILATSVLQLHDTPWLANQNWKEDVRFVRAKGKRSPFAYIQKRFEGRVQNGPTARRGSQGGPIRNNTIFALGVTLIELSLGHTLRYFQRPEDLGEDGQPNFLTDFSIAQRLIMEDVQEKEGLRYANTVNRCINCIFDGLDPSLEDDQFRQAFYESAVVPLKEVRDDFLR